MASLSRKSHLAALAGLVVASLTWHAASISRQSLHVDEVNEARVARGSLNQLWSAPDSMPPLYAAALSGWLKAGSPESARWISAACGVASIMVVWLLGWEAAGAGAAVAVATLWALNPLQLYYAQMVRGYALYMLLIAMAMWLLFRALRTDAVRDWAGLVVVGVTGMFTHYYFALFLAVAATIAAMARRGSDWRRPTAAFAAIGLLAAPTLFCLQYDFSYQRDLREPQTLTPAAAAYTYFSLLSGYSLGPSTSELHEMSGRDAARQAWPWAAALALACAPLALAGAAPLRERRRLGPVVALIVAPVLMAGAIGWLGTITYNVRHVAWIAVPVCVWLGAGAAQVVRHRFLAIPIAALIALLLTATYQRYWLPRYQNEDVRSASAYLAGQGQGDTVLVVSDYMLGPLGYYLGDAATLVTLPEPGAVSRVVRNQDDALQGLAAAQGVAKEGAVVWLAASREFHGDPRGALRELLTEHFQLQLVAEFAGIRLYRSVP